MLLDIRLYGKLGKHFEREEQKMKLNRIVKMLLVSVISICCLAGCSGEKKEADFSGINSVCEFQRWNCKSNYIMHL